MYKDNQFSWGSKTPEPRFQYYRNSISQTYPTGEVTLSRFLQSICRPKNPEVYRHIAAASATGNEELKARLKQSLYAVTPCVQVNGLRRYNDISLFTGLLCLDFDKLHTPQVAIEMKEHLFQEHDCIVATWLSSSGLGVRCLINIPIVSTVEQFKAHFWGVQLWAEQYYGFDDAPKNAVLLLFTSYDPGVLYRPNARQSTTTAKDPRAIKTQKGPVDNTQAVVKPGDKDHIQRIVKNGFERIEYIRLGHPNVVRLARAVGGYVASGYITEDEAVALLIREIEGNTYLSKNVRGYSKTARWAINQGQLRPLKLTLYD